MKRGEVWVVDLGAKTGKRPVVILTRSGVIPYVNKLTVAEITSHGKGYPTEVDIDQKANLPQPSFVQLDDLQTVSKQRFEKFIGTLDDSTMKTLSEKVVLALNLEDAY
ncbi:MAG: type II toxin-antitoxin system PemK/MazF family toxin [candidate division KSB1 bacterium]|nr:type II toxin-antitoxin system PemK/MazF family toxin [candidate division KSB1 bacterium]MDZ7300591.1 type II toxin-antitoxin system PemK/MazF family toxin [candidate division KSB1 bacterium]MDZ7309728.1 type II toxin-antitoxin system PemK/MazF family toxin [candidate division KSB1 bacterium]